jgi:DNA adenine methylase
VDLKTAGCIWCYHGSKIRYIENILGVIPEHNKDYKIIDLFSGGSSVATNLPPNWRVTANDYESRVVEFSKDLQYLLCRFTPYQVEAIIRNHCRSAVTSNKDESGYLSLKAEYNKGDRTALNLFALTMASNSNMIRFNSSGEQTLQFGKRWYNSSSSKKMLSYLNRLATRYITFQDKDFRYYTHEDDYDIWIIDPPYKTSKATYSENGQWNISEEVALLSMCDKLDKIGKKFIYFNQTFTQDKENEVVNTWKDKYSYVVLADTTTNCSAQRKNVGVTTEIMVHNF